jgi:hypothetical protein
MRTKKAVILAMTLTGIACLASIGMLTGRAAADGPCWCLSQSGCAACRYYASGAGNTFSMRCQQSDTFPVCNYKYWADHKSCTNSTTEPAVPCGPNAYSYSDAYCKDDEYEHVNGCTTSIPEADEDPQKSKDC